MLPSKKCSVILAIQRIMPTFAEETKKAKLMFSISRLIDRYRSLVADSPEWLRICIRCSLLSCAIMPIVWLMCCFAYDSGGISLKKDFVVAVVCTYPLWIIPLNVIVLLVYRFVRVKYVALLAYLLPIPITYAGLNYIDSHVFGSDCYNSYDPRIFHYTPAKELVDAIMKEDTVTVGKIMKKSPELAKYEVECHEITVFGFAFNREKYASVRMMIRMGVSPNTVVGSMSFKNLPLHSLASEPLSKKNLYMIKWLIDNGADVNARLNHYDKVRKFGDFTPLHSLCLHGGDYPQIAALLVEKGADVNAIRIDYESKEATPLDDAARNNCPKLAIYLLTHGAKRTPSARYFLSHPQEATPDARRAWELYNAEQVDSIGGNK